MKKYLIFDFNGTLIDDVDLCIALLNEFLLMQNKPTIEEKKYKEIFGFPIKNYYIKAGLDFNLNKFEDLAVIYNEKYMKRSLDCKLYPEVLDTLEALKKLNINMIVLSATEINNLIYQLKYYNIYGYFKDVLGTSNYEGNSKVDIGLNYIKDNNIANDDILIIGDSLHDYEVSSKMNCDCVLFSKGHMSKERLEASGVPVIDDLRDIIDYIK
ncbi:MAG: HAD family hydrolase [Anaeroplasmataceae bacterium]